MMITPFVVHFEMVRGDGEMVGHTERILRNRKARALPMSILMIASVFAVVFMMVSTVWGEPVPKATGSASVYNGEEEVAIKFTVFDTSDLLGGDRGKFTYADHYGSYELDVVETKVVDHDYAVFAGLAIESNHPKVPVGQWMVVYVWDGGEPGVKVDRYVDERAEDKNEAYSLVHDATPPSSPFIVLGGNINVLLPISEIPED